jgi:hypothetical protein
MRTVLVATVLLASCRYDGGRFTSGEIDAPPSDDAIIDTQVDTLLEGCAGWWKMDEADWTGGVIDSCGGDDNGAPSGSALLEDDPLRGRTARTTDGCITVPDSPRMRPGAAFTVSAWIRPNCTCDDEGIITKRTGFNMDSAFALYLTKNGGVDYHLWVDVDTEDNRFEHTGDTFAMGWRLVTLTFDGSKPREERVSIYLDGALKTHVAEDATSVRNPTGTPPPVSIGCLPNGGQSLNGLVDDVAMWSRALSSSEVQAWYARTLPP